MIRPERSCRRYDLGGALFIGLSVIVYGAFCVMHSVTACRQSVRRVFDLGRVVAYYAVLVVDVGVAS